MVKKLVGKKDRVLDKDLIGKKTESVKKNIFFVLKKSEKKFRSETRETRVGRT